MPLIDIDQLLTAPVDCDVCGREWVAVWPRGVQRLECPGCGFMTIAPPESDGEDEDDKGVVA